MRTGDNDRFLRYWQEVTWNNTGIGFNKLDALKSKKKWFPYNKGGGFNKWYGNNELLVNWKNDGAEIKALTRQNYPQLGDNLSWKITNEHMYFNSGITWGGLTSAIVSFRWSDCGALFDSNKGAMIFPESEDRYLLLGFLNSYVVQFLLNAINPTLSTKNSDIDSLPLLIDEMKSALSQVTDIVTKAVMISKGEENAYETSWDFTTLPLLDPAFRGPTLAATYTTLRAHWQAMTDEMQRLEEANNRLFIDAYGLQDELTADVPLAEITLTCNPHYRYGGKRTTAELEALLLADTMREFISYAVGCLFGRYSLDKPGLILANQGETVGEYVEKVFGESGQSSVISHQYSVTSGQSGGRRVATDALITDNCPLITEKLLPDADNVIPILDAGDWFADDLCARVQDFLRLTFGEEHYAENLRFVEEALGRDLRGYLLRDFYNDHMRRYQKRPIYWLFASPNGSFNALIYLHRYRADTVSVVLNDYLREFRSKLTAERAHQQLIAIDAAAPQRDKTQALRQIDKFDKILAELQSYEDDVLYPLATQQITLDLDDGVKVNYNKLGSALKKVSGLSE